MTSSSSYSAKSLTVVAAILTAGAVIAASVLIWGPRRPLNLAHTVNIEQHSPLRIEFPMLMDHASAEKEFSITPHVEGSLAWEGETLVFSHEVPLESGGTYVVVINKEALTKEQTVIGRDITFRFIVSGPPSIAARFPSIDARDVLTKNDVTIVFDRPMVPLTQVQGMPEDLASPPVTLEPKTPGSWRWISTYALQFVPKTELLPSTHYTVTLPAGLPSVDGGTSTGTLVWSFETARMTVTGSDPADSQERISTKTGVKITFNQDVDPAVIAKSLSLVALTPEEFSGAMNDTAKPVSYGSRAEAAPIAKVVQAQTDKKNDPRSVFVTFGKELEKSATYALIIKAGVVGKGGNLPTEKEQYVRFKTAGPLKVEEESFQYGTLYFTFSTPVEEKALEGMFSISPDLAAWKNKSVSMDYWSENRYITISAGFLPGTTYTVTIDPKLKDKFGQTLGAAHTFTFTTPDLDPNVLIESKGEFGLFESSLPPIYTVKSTNVSFLNVQVNELTLDQFLEYRKARNSGVYSPANFGTPLATLKLPVKNAARNAWNTYSVDLEKELKRDLKAGIYSMVITAPEFKGTDGRPYEANQVFMLSKTALTLKFSNGKALVWATDMESGEPVDGANISLFGLTGSAPITGRTGKDGLFSTNIDLTALRSDGYSWVPEFWIKAENKGDIAYVGSTWTTGMEPWSFGLWSDFVGAGSKQYRFLSDVQTDRPVYRPRDTVQFKGTVRLRDKNGQMSIPKSPRAIDVLINDPNSTEVYRKTLQISEFGTISGSLPLPENAALGTYSFTLSAVPSDDIENSYYSYGGTASFSVLEYRKPEYRVELTPAKAEAFAGETVTIDLAGSYYFGAPLNSAPVTWRAQMTDYYFDKVQDEWYMFGDSGNWCWYDCSREIKLLSEGTGTLDSAGRMKITVPASLEGKKTSQMLTVEADITDPNNQSVSNRVTIPVHQSNVYVGIRTDDYGVSPGESASIKIITVDTAGKPRASQRVSLKIYSRSWNTIKKQGVDGEFYFENEPVDTFVRELSATTGSDGKAVVEAPMEKGGENHIVAETTDSEGRTIKSGTSVYVWSEMYVNWPHENNNRVEVVADKPMYKAGDTAKLLIKTPFQGKGVKALVTVERENVMRTEVKDVESSALPIEVKITEDDIPNVFVSVIIEKPRVGETFDDEGIDTGVPAFRIGYARLQVEKEPKRLKVTLETDKQQYLPKDKVQTTLTVTDSTGKPVRGEFSLAVVDSSVLALTGYTRPDLIETFWLDRGLGTYTAHALTYLIDRYKIGSKGGGGGAPDPDARENFVDTAFWTPRIVTDENGRATVSFALPDNLTTWKLITVGGTQDNRFGATDIDIVSTKNVIVRQVHPRFAVAGDAPTISGIVHNFLPTSRTFTVTLSGTGFNTKGETAKNVTVEPKGQAKVSFPITVLPGKELSIRMVADTYDAKDDVTEKIPVYVYSTPQTVATTGNTDSVVTEQVAIPAKDDASKGTLSVTVASTIATYLPGGLQYAYEYPYGCAEQTASSFVPLVLVSQLSKYKAFQFLDKPGIDKHLQSSLQRLYRFQRSDGGFGYWEGSYRSEPVLSAYILFALKTAQNGGYAVDSSVMSQVKEYLQRELRTKVSDDEIDLATRTYILYILAETGSPDRQALNAMYERRAKLPVFSRSELAMALKGTGSDAKAKEVLQSVLDNVRIDARGAHVEESEENRYRILMQNTTRTTAETLQAMVRIDPDNVLVPQMMRFLLTIRENNHWDTTQSTTQSILALVEYLKVKETLSPDMTAEVNIDGKDVVQHEFKADNALTRASASKSIDDFARGETVDIKIGKEGKGTLYYDVVLSTEATAAELPPEERGLSIIRSFSPADAKDNTVLRTAKVGQTYKMTLTITAPKDRHFVAIESPIPAGMELIDSSLKTSRQIAGENGPQPTVTQRPWWYWSAFDIYYSREEFRDDRLFLFTEHMNPGVYKYTAFVRATTPGTYRLRPAHVWEMYYPETFGQSDGMPFTITE